MATASSSRNAELYWLALHLVPGLGARNALKLIRTFGNPQAIFHASFTELKSCGLRAAVSEAIHSGISFEDASAEVERAQAAGAEVVAFQDARYPERLREIYDPPTLLYARGRTELLSSDTMAIVGSRRPTPYGTGVAQKFGRELCRAGMTVVSGMARGIDSWAHRGALDAGGGTIAVFGCGADVVYPKENQKLMAEIVDKGRIVSEFPMGSTSFPQNFPIRNRVISGLSMGVMVVEGAQYSGSLITARLALDQGREVFAVPGSIASKASWGPNLLIKQGAKLVQETNDILEELPLAVRQQAADRSEEARKNGATSTPDQASIWQASASPLGKQLLALIRVDTSIHIDELIRLCEGRSSASVLGGTERTGVVRCGKTTSR